MDGGVVLVDAGVADSVPRITGARGNDQVADDIGGWLAGALDVTEDRAGGDGCDRRPLDRRLARPADLRRRAGRAEERQRRARTTIETAMATTTRAGRSDGPAWRAGGRDRAVLRLATFACRPDGLADETGLTATIYRLHRQKPIVLSSSPRPAQRYWRSAAGTPARQGDDGPMAKTEAVGSELPPDAKRRLQELEGTEGRPGLFTSDLSVNEFLLVKEARLRAAAAS